MSVYYMRLRRLYHWQQISASSRQNCAIFSKISIPWYIPTPVQNVFSNSVSSLQSESQREKSLVLITKRFEKFSTIQNVGLKTCLYWLYWIVENIVFPKTKQKRRRTIHVWGVCLLIDEKMEDGIRTMTQSSRERKLWAGS